MLAHRIIPTLLMRGEQLVKGRQFQSWRTVGHVRQAIRVYQQRQCDELILLDIGATPEGRGPDFALIESLAADCRCPLTVGGGVRTVEDVRRLLASGADKVAICTGLNRKGFLTECAQRFGAQAIVAAIDVRFGPRGCERLVSRNCGAVSTLVHPRLWALQCEQEGAGEILLTSIDSEGMMEGYDLELVRAVSEAVSVPVVAHGGAGTYEHLREAIDAGASAVAAGAMWSFTDQTPAGAARYLNEHGIKARSIA